MTTSQPGQDGQLRAAQIAAVQGLLTNADLYVAGLAAELVDAVMAHAAPQPTACPACVTDPHDEPERPHVHATTYGYAIYAPDRLALVNELHAAGYAAAVANLRDVAQRTGSPAAQWAADYLKAVGPAQTAVDGAEPPHAEQTSGEDGTAGSGTL